MKNLSPAEKRIIKEIESIRNIVYEYDLEDEDWIKEARPHKLAIERDELIRGYIILEHLLVDEFFNLTISNYFTRQLGAKKTRIFDESVLEKLNYLQKLEIVREIKQIPGKILDKMYTLNTLRRQCAHIFYLRGKRRGLRHKGKSIFVIKNFKKLVEDMSKIDAFIQESF